MRAAIWIAFLANLTAYPLSNGLLPYIARDISGTNQTGLGYLSASFAVGSLAGSIALSLVGGIRLARLMVGASAELAGVALAVAYGMVGGFAPGLRIDEAEVIDGHDLADRERIVHFGDLHVFRARGGARERFLRGGARGREARDVRAVVQREAIARLRARKHP